MWKYRWWLNCLEVGFCAHRYTWGIYDGGSRNWEKCLSVTDASYLGWIEDAEMVRPVNMIITTMFTAFKKDVFSVCSGWTPLIIIFFCLNEQKTPFPFLSTIWYRRKINILYELSNVSGSSKTKRQHTNVFFLNSPLRHWLVCSHVSRWWASWVYLIFYWAGWCKTGKTLNAWTNAVLFIWCNVVSEGHNGAITFDINHCDALPLNGVIFIRQNGIIEPRQ